MSRLEGINKGRFFFLSFFRWFVGLSVAVEIKIFFRKRVLGDMRRCVSTLNFPPNEGNQTPGARIQGSERKDVVATAISFFPENYPCLFFCFFSRMDGMVLGTG